MPRWTPDGLKPIRKVSLAGVASYSFNAAQGLDLTNYRRFVFELEGVLTTTDVGNVWVRTSGDSGSTDYDVAGQLWAAASTFTSNLNSGAGAAQIRLTPGDLGSVDANELGISGTVSLVHGGSALAEPCLEFDVQFRTPSAVAFYVAGMAYRKSTSQITSVDFLTADGANFEKGEISIYGVRRIA